MSDSGQPEVSVHRGHGWRLSQNPASPESFVMRRHDYAQADDAELLSLTASDPEAFGVFYERFEAQILGFFWRATRRAQSITVAGPPAI